MSADPLAVHAPGQADLNLYAYVRGYVLKSVDPLGLEDESLISPAIPSSGAGGLDEMMANLDALQAELDGKPAPVAADEIPEAQQQAYLNQARTQAAEEHSRGQHAAPTVDEIQEVGDVASGATAATVIGDLASSAIDALNAAIDLAQGQWGEASARGVGAVTPFVTGALVRGAKKALAEGVEAAAEGTADQVNLASQQVTEHILHGDKTGGGHMFPGNAGKSPFPQDWTGDRIMHEVSDVATDPASSVASGRGKRTLVSGTRDGVDITVVVEAPGKGGGIVTAFPTNVPRNP